MSARPVARVVSAVLGRIGLLAVLATAVVVAGVIVSSVAIDDLTQRLEPAAGANQAVYQDLTDLSAAAASWSSTGLPGAADDYRQAGLRLTGHEQEVRSFADGDRGLTSLVTAQEKAVDAWIRGYGEPLIHGRPGTPPTAEQAKAGNAAFKAVRDAHAATAQAFDSRVRDASSGVAWRLRGTALATIVVMLVSWGLVARSRRRLTSELTAPLLSLERVVQRMADGDHQIRAQPAGPKEVRAIAESVNAFAEGHTRARAVEAWIQREQRTLDTARDDFVANVSHELRTPLTTISGYLELVAEEFDGSLQPRHERMLEATRRNVSRLRALIDDLLTLQRAEGRPSQLEPVDLVAQLRDVVLDVKITAARRGIRIALSEPLRPVMVQADRPMLHRALLNVVTNAVKFSHDDGVVEVGVVLGRDGVDVTVTDHGIGIPTEELGQLGTRFFRASNAVTNEIAGTGLGVRIMQTIIDRHSGSVVFDSTEGAGTTVTVRLPVVQATRLTLVADEPDPALAPESEPIG